MQASLPVLSLSFSASDGGSWEEEEALLLAHAYERW